MTVCPRLLTLLKSFWLAQLESRGHLYYKRAPPGSGGTFMCPSGAGGALVSVTVSTPWWILLCEKSRCTYPIRRLSNELRPKSSSAHSLSQGLCLETLCRLRLLPL